LRSDFNLQNIHFMKAIRIHSFGGPEKVQLEEIETPVLKEGEALVRVRAAGVNPVDWMVREKIYNPEGQTRVPITLGQDFAGEIVEIEPGAKFKVGDEVFGQTWGSFCEFAAVPIKDLVLKPKSLDFVRAASVPMVALTAWQMVIDTAQADRGKRFLIHGASGGVGFFAAQFAKWKGAEVIATASRASFESLKKIGVDLLIDYKNDKFYEKVRDVDVVIDPLGGEIQARSWPLLKKGGMLINLIGEIDEVSARKAGVRGVEFGVEYHTEDLEEIGRLLDQGVIRTNVVQVLPLERAREAMDLNQQGRSHGKVILKVA
jgi:NADPH:quinone reductase-like Zn-dependent oxidoreductase